MGQSRTGLDVQVGGLKAGGAGVSSSGVPVGGLSMYRSGLPWRIYNGISTWLDRRFGWDKLPVPLSLAVLVGLRSELRRRNLYDSSLLPTGTLLELPDPPEDYSLRTVDGSSNDLTAPRSGRAGARFGRNIPLSSIDPYPEATLLEPSPREISKRLQGVAYVPLFPEPLERFVPLHA